MILDKLSLAGKVALVTGSSAGLGRGIALALAQAGADLALVARREAQLRETAGEVEGYGRRALVLPADVTDAAQVRGLVDSTLGEYGGIDILCNAAGANRRLPLLEMSEADWDAILSANLKSVFLVSQSVAKHMVTRQRGKIINICSLTTVIGIENIAAYGASKGGVAQLTKGMAVEWAKYHLNVNAIGPGYFHTHLTDAVFADPARAAWVRSRIPFGKEGVPEDLAGAAVYLASEASDYVTGQIIFVDGGWLAG
ncbi:MAG: glucose 1-dehydrogenase [Chloroflexi bacterium]|nr:glucose 1-dehydrogenase [Chloroflexota bacterium]MCL5110960.1 glucose 1-dehydrogenase [Chloroflexota bacterium]